MYYSWTGKICIFITVINFPDNNRHTTVFLEKAYFSTIMEYFVLHKAPPRMSSKNHKVFTIFFAFFPIKPLFSYRGRFIKVTKIQGWTLYKCYRLSYSGCCIKTTKSIISILSNTSLSFHHHAYKWLLHIFEALPVSTFQIP